MPGDNSAIIRRDNDIAVSASRDSGGRDRHIRPKHIRDISLTQGRGRQIVQQDRVARGNCVSRDVRLVSDSTRQQGSAVGLVVESGGSYLLPINIGFWRLELGHLFAGLSHMSGYNGLYGHRPDGRAKVSSIELNLRVVAGLANG